MKTQQTTDHETPSEVTGNFIWLDLELSGLDFEYDVILEVAIHVTDSKLNILDNGYEAVISQSNDILSSMDNWNTKHHTESGLIDKVRSSKLTVEEVETAVLKHIGPYTEEKTSPLCGNSIWVDRAFIRKYMPKFERRLHYRMIDISSIKVLAQRWYPDVQKHKNEREHSALIDIRNSIAELKYYREHIFK